jgi:hypothetical protein
MKTGVVVLCIWLYTTSCTKSIGEIESHHYKTEINPILITHCTQNGCHNGREKKLGDFSVYEDVQRYIKPGFPAFSELYIQISGASPEMPPKHYPALSTAEIYKIRHWIARGAPKDSSEIRSCDSSEATFSKTVFPIIQTWCSGCHSGSAPGGGIILQDYVSVQAESKQLRFMGSIMHYANYSAMPKNSSPLSACDISKLKRWVQNGSPND